MEEATLSPIQEFYRGSTVFITGGTGFVGHILVEKLLRSCYVDKIYIMVREKRGKNMKERIQELFEGKEFDPLRKKQPEFQQKVIGVYGDCSELGLGLSKKDKSELIEHVNFVFHCAANVNFIENLVLSIKINVRGTRELLQLAKQMKKLIFCTHVSTAYVHCTNDTIDESFKKCNYTPKQLITIAEEIPAPINEKIKEIIVGPFPNTYILSKSVSEQLIEESCDFPIAVMRPAGIVSTFKEPIPGWVNNYYGPQGVVVNIMRGILRTTLLDDQVNCNIIPVDMCVNAILAMTWDARNKFDDVYKQNRAENNRKLMKYQIPIYNYESNSSNPLNWNQFLGLLHFRSWKMWRTYFFKFRKNNFLHLLAKIFLHYFPACLIDFGLICRGKKPRMLKMYKKVHKYTLAISYFCTRNWQYESENMKTLYDNMSQQDTEIFFCDIRKLDWPQFLKTYAMGCRRYLLNEPV